MIEEYYGLSAAPFRLVPDPRFFYASDTHQKALSYLEYGLQQGEGFVVMTGEVGTGKSTLVGHLLDNIDRSRIEVAHIATTNILAADALWLIADNLGIRVEETGKAPLLRGIELHLERQALAGKRILLIVDEAQNLPTETLEELRMLTNLQVHDRYPLQCFLVGQSQLRQILAAPGFEQLRQRVIASYSLEPLSLEETRNYAEHRLHTAGWRGRPSFDDALLEQVHEATKGIPRRINMLLGRLLLFGALEEIDHLDSAAIANVITDLENEVVGMGRGNGQAVVSVTEPASPDRLRHLEARINELERLLLDIVEMVGGLLAQREARAGENGEHADQH
jgi:general secretion pathway protein A